MELKFPELEHKILEFWKKDKTFEKSIKQRAKARDFVFYEGPPTANGKPGLHHVLARSYKDIICRYKTMRGFRVLRKAGWDTHGLPVELEIEKKLGLKNKKDIEKYGIAEFNKKCRESVWQYKDEWEKLTTRIGFWLDMENPYITYENSYIESLWHIIKQIHQKGLLYKGHKVVPYCPRCGTALSSHEVAQGYKAVKENSIFVKFKIQPDTYLLVWTTTPWTLPANAAIAVNPKFVYAKVKFGVDNLILAKERLSVLGEGYQVIEELKGQDLIGLEYERLFGEVRPPQEVGPRVIAGDFVSLDEGTGLVHIAPAFGVDDMQVGKKNNLPVILNVDEEGKFKPEVKQWAGIFVKDADPLIIKNLKEKNLLFKEELHEHDYPFCWRCSSPLLYYAKESWFINMQKGKKDLIQNSQKINWVPAYLKEGRFGEWLKEVKDWAFSRERYWGTPLPVWQCKKCQHQAVIGSRQDLLNQKFSNNKYFILRHGESVVNVKKLANCWPEKIHYPLTEKGKRQIRGAVQKLKKEKIDLIFSSDLLRTKQTAEIVGQELGSKINFDERLRDVNIGIFNGKPLGKTGEFWNKGENLTPLEHYSKRFQTAPPEGENYVELEKRMFGFIKEMDQKYQGKNILIVSHKRPFTLLEKVVLGYDMEKFVETILKEKEIKTGELRKLEFKNLPYNEKMELDFHRPYIDEVRFRCSQCAGLMERAPELIDVWFDSGSMPFATVAQFPADYICEGIDQTRGWFYTLLAVATLLGKGAPYKNVISLGHVLDEKGEKMSKSKGNVVDPQYIIEKYGSDAVRWYFYTVNQPGDVKLFAEKDVGGNLKKFIMTYWNCFAFYQTYQSKGVVRRRTSNNILDKWIVSRLNELINEVTKRLDQYDVTPAARAIEAFIINDLSLWYIRRSRKRFEEASSTLYFVLLTLSKLTAPFVPFLSEEIRQGIQSKYLPRVLRFKYPREVVKFKIKNSVHLKDWPKADKKLVDKKLNQEMEKVRGIVSLALAERAKAGIKVRQPLASLKIRNPQAEIRNNKELLNLIQEEVNIKEIVFDSKIKKEIELNTKITPELKEEGMVRDAIRQIQDMRKQAGLKPADKISIEYSGTPELNEVLMKNKNFILQETKAKDFHLASKPKVDQESLGLSIKKL